jgi:metal-sulfur cluster biosynthetic enzyme
MSGIKYQVSGTESDYTLLSGLRIEQAGRSRGVLSCGQATPRHYNQRQELLPTRGESVITEERVQDQLRNVIDPEIGMDLVELGLIYDVGVHDDGRHVDVTFSLTSPMCPVGDMIQEQVETETLSIEGVETVNAQLTFEPMWSPEMMSPAAKLFFGR